ncbi:MAG: tetratricopeptide repeat protein, partial [Chloroflexi bacterium]|nr:tetratricopeptide repeat protein [Chloroflexota bacterium]
MELDQLIQMLRSEPHRYALLLGAGASVSSDYPLGEHDLPGNPSVVTHIACAMERFGGGTQGNAAASCRAKLEAEHRACGAAVSLYEWALQWVGADSSSRTTWLRREITPGSPTVGPGYHCLVRLQAAEQLRVVFTTNFDGLAQRAWEELRPQHQASVVSWDEAVPSAPDTSFAPVVYELHGGFAAGFTRNLGNESAEVGKRFADRLNTFLDQGTIVVVGYAGAGAGLKDGLLKALATRRGDRRLRLIWALRGGEALPEYLQRFAGGNHAAVTTLAIESADQLLCDLAAVLPPTLRCSPGLHLELRGRDDKVSQVKEILLGSESRRWATVTGPRGIGKSALLEHISRNLEGGMKAARLDPKVGWAAFLRALAAAVDPSLPAEPLALKRALEDQPRVLILDDLPLPGTPERDELEHVLNEAAPPRCPVLAATWRQALTGSYEVPLSPLEPDAVRQIITDRAPGKATRGDLERLAGALGGNPSAAVAAAACLQRGYRVKDLLGSLDRRQEPARELLEVQPVDAWSISRLCEDLWRRLAPTEQNAWKACSALGDAALSLALLSASVGIDCTAAAGGLCDLGLLMGGPYGPWSMPTLLRLWGKSRLSPDEHLAIARRAAVDLGNWPERERCPELAHAADHVLAAKMILEQGSDGPSLYSLAATCHQCLVRFGRADVTVALWEAFAGLQAPADRLESRAATRVWLGAAYSDLADVRDKETNLSRAITAYTEALKVYTLAAFPVQYATTQNNLGAAYSSLSDVRDKETNLSLAITAYTEALKVYTLAAFPMDYAMTQNNLGAAYSDLGDVRDKETNLSLAITAYSEALKVYTLAAFPVQYATTQNNLGNAYRSLADVRDKETNLSLAITAYTEALKVRTLAAFPVQYSMTQNNLGTAYGRLAEVRDREQNLGQAIAAYSQ